MTVAHHRAVLIRRSPAGAAYRFYPDHVSHPKLSGEFEIERETLDFSVVTRSDRGAVEGLRTDELCVSALVHKIRKALIESPELPNEVFFIA